MKTLVLVPDPATAYGFGEMLAAMQGTRPRVIAYGSATAAALPEGLDTYVYPIRDGSRLPAPFLDALVEHEQPDVILAPAGATGASSAPVLLVDLDPRVNLDEAISFEDGSVVGWIEAITGMVERRPQLLRAGLFSVDYLPNWFAGAGKLAASSAGPMTARLADLASLAGSHSKRSEPVEGVRIPVTSGTESSPAPLSTTAAIPIIASTDHETGPAPIEQTVLEAPRVVEAPHEFPSIDFAPNEGPSIEAPALDTPPIEVAPPESAPLEVVSNQEASFELAHPHSEPTVATTPDVDGTSSFELMPEPMTAGSSQPHALDLASPDRYRTRNAGATALVLASLQGLDALTASELAHATVIAVPETLAWLTARMGLAQFVCVAQEPRSAEAAASLSTTRTVVVHSDHLMAETLAPRARACIALHDLSRSGGPSLGWSDELQQGYFPAGGDAALALQWALWIGASEVIVAGSEALSTRPGWTEFWKGTQQLLSARGVSLQSPGTPVPAMSVSDAVDRLGSTGTR